MCANQKYSLDQQFRISFSPVCVGGDVRHQEKGCHGASYGNKNQQRKIVGAAHIPNGGILKKQILSVVATLIMIVPMAIIGFAGLYGTVNATIPFDFMVGDKEFKAGKYSVSRLYADNPDGTLVIRDAASRAAAYFNIDSIVDKGGQRARLIFHRYGNQYFLAQIFDGQSGLGSALLKSKAEREASKKRDIITHNTVEPESMLVVPQTGG